MTHRHMKMHVDFFKGSLRGSSGGGEPTREVYWARGPFGIDAVARGSEELLEVFDPDGVMAPELITSVELPGLDMDNARFITRAILTGGYLDRPQVRGKGDAVLFMLVNEALHALSRDEDDS